MVMKTHIVLFILHLERSKFHRTFHARPKPYKYLYGPDSFINSGLATLGRNEELSASGPNVLRRMKQYLSHLTSSTNNSSSATKYDRISSRGNAES
jgi:hypothetical protein